MKVILTEDVKGTGKKGQVVDASDGHARNFLLPRKLAVEASEHNLSELETKKKSVEDRAKRELENAKEMKEKLEKTSVRVAVKTGDTGRLFGAVTTKEVAAALMEQFGLSVDKKRIVIDEHIKTVGEHKAQVKLHAEVAAELPLNIVRIEEK